MNNLLVAIAGISPFYLILGVIVGTVVFVNVIFIVHLIKNVFFTRKE